LDFDFDANGGVFPCTSNRSRTAEPRWLEKVIHILPVAARPPDYSPLGRKQLIRMD
jgi:hypothetical protein